MKKSLNFISGAVWGLLFFFIPALKSGLYGFPLYEFITTSLLFLFILYVVLSIPVFAVYIFVIRKRKFFEINFNAIARSFAIFMLGFFASAVLYFAFGFIGFSRGEFGL